ncbi:hypothetical protein [Fischerella thermalis]|uniref:hypothetical protein n=1 Tax=Fischerella thermalis TaxID=372787 RepID=UPI00138B0E57|nr:hypothetical protein [Fischerella thermalis]
MHIHLDADDFSRMPQNLRTQLLDWVFKTKHLQFERVPANLQREIKVPAKQLHIFEIPTQEENAEHSQVRLSQLFDAGITNQGMSVRVKLKREVAKKLQRDYINGLEISVKGTIFYKGEEFDKPSPLAAKINGGAINGWEYIEVKKDDKWVRLEELRKIWRKTNG